jgi:hypothetical protein
MKTPASLLTLSLVLIFSGSALAADTKAKTKSSGKAKVDLDLPTFGAIPKGDDIKKPNSTDTNLGLQPTETAASATYAVTKVMHAKAFTRGPSGAQPVEGGYSAIPLSGTPPSTPKFTTVVRVKSPQRANTSIDVVILDPRDDTAMSSKGEVNFAA